MFFRLYNDKNDTVGRMIRHVSDNIVSFLLHRFGETLRGLRQHLLTVLMLFLTACLECSAAEPPFLDTFVRLGSPLLARVQFPNPVTANQGLIRLSNQSEVISVGGRWLGLYDSFELVPAVAKSGVYYLNSRMPLDRESFEIYLAQENMDALEIFVFEVRLVDETTRVNARTLQTQSDSVITPLNSSVIPLPRQDAELAPPQRSNVMVYPTTQPPEVELDDDLSEKLRALITAQATSGQNNVSRPANDAVNVNDTNVVDTDSLSDAPSNRSISRVSSENAVITNTSPSDGMTELARQPSVMPDQYLDIPVPTSEKQYSIFDWQLSMASLLAIAVVGWMVYFGLMMFGLKERLSSNTSGSNNQSPNLSNSNVSSGTYSSEVHASTGRDEQRASSSRSVLADVLRSTAEQAERTEKLGQQARINAHFVELAAAQQQVLFDCAARLQSLKPARDFASDVVPTQMPAQPQGPKSASASRSNVMSEQSTNNAEGSSSLPKTALSPESGRPSQLGLSESSTRSGPISNPADKRRMAPQRGEKTIAPNVPKGRAMHQGPAMKSAVSSSADNQDTVPKQSQNYSEQFSLAVVYFNMGEVDTARDLLNVVVKEGSTYEQAEARKFLQEKFDE